MSGYLYKYGCNCPSCASARDKETSYTQQQTQEQFIKWALLEIKKQSIDRRGYIPQLEVDKINNTTKQPLVDYKYSPVYTEAQDDIKPYEPRDLDMTGAEYVRKQYGQNYRHLRMMLQCLWEIENVPSHMQFDIDYRFKRDCSAISSHLKEYADYALNEAHNLARSRYKVGRPVGARNKDKVLGTDEASSFEPLIDDMTTEQSNQISQEEINKLQNKDSMYSSKEFVTHNQLLNKNYVTVNGVDQVVNKVGEALRIYINEEIAKIQLQAPTIVELKRGNLPDIKLGIQHREFPTLLRMCSAALRSGHHLNVWVYGPAGTGKSTAAEKVSEALELRFYTLGKQSTEYGILGFINVSGYQTTEFRRAYENGGIFCGDEIDGWMPDALIALNMALANGHCAFPDKMVKRHPNFIFIACANTTGTGATMDYVGRMKQDAAFLDRFVSLYWPLDEALEDSLVANKNWLLRVRAVRENVQHVGIKGHLITPRAAIFGESLLAAGLTIDQVEASTLKKGLSDTQWQQVKPLYTWTN